MNQDFRNLTQQINLSQLGCWLTVFLVCWLLASLGLSGIIKSVAVLIAFILLAPVIGFAGLQWWLKRNIVEAPCPVCDYTFTGFKKMDCRCPNCGEPLKVEGGQFQRITPPGTIDVEAVEVSVQQLED
ncbi:MAG: hypothetical protein SAJ12_05820 [Jaaginema sp. PMC 1079.18]|nr:hypothetical protein [Jaaginema sp. PMC 1080.18]MEC4850508.1 hypothetical protein [Jaaginema sp. PMC 1079.18]MEC4864765.1 hypothetical protein [Jaaginema sp. PMC 1078.18]